jgi:hypothetical protein
LFDDVLLINNSIDSSDAKIAFGEQSLQFDRGIVSWGEFGSGIYAQPWWTYIDVHASSASTCATGYSRGGSWNDKGFHFLTPTQLNTSHATLCRQYLTLKIKSFACTPPDVTKKHPELFLRDGYSVGTYQVVKTWEAIELLLLLLFDAMITTTCIADGEYNVIVLIGLIRCLWWAYFSSWG